MISDDDFIAYFRGLAEIRPPTGNNNADYAIDFASQEIWTEAGSVLSPSMESACSFPAPSSNSSKRSTNWCFDGNHSFTWRDTRFIRCARGDGPTKQDVASEYATARGHSVLLQGHHMVGGGDSRAFPAVMIHSNANLAHTSSRVFCEALTVCAADGQCIIRLSVPPHSITSFGTCMSKWEDSPSALDSACMGTFRCLVHVDYVSSAASNVDDEVVAALANCLASLKSRESMVMEYYLYATRWPVDPTRNTGSSVAISMLSGILYRRRNSFVREIGVCEHLDHSACVKVVRPCLKETQFRDDVLQPLRILAPQSSRHDEIMQEQATALEFHAFNFIMWKMKFPDFVPERKPYVDTTKQANYDATISKMTDTDAGTSLFAAPMLAESITSNIWLFLHRVVQNNRERSEKLPDSSVTPVCSLKMLWQRYGVSFHSSCGVFQVAYSDILPLARSLLTQYEEFELIVATLPEQSSLVPRCNLRGNSFRCVCSVAPKDAFCDSRASTASSDGEHRTTQMIDGCVLLRERCCTIQWKVQRGEVELATHWIDVDTSPLRSSTCLNTSELPPAVCFDAAVTLRCHHRGGIPRVGSSTKFTVRFIYDPIYSIGDFQSGRRYLASPLPHDFIPNSDVLIAEWRYKNGQDWYGDNSLLNFPSSGECCIFIRGCAPGFVRMELHNRWVSCCFSHEGDEIVPRELERVGSRTCPTAHAPVYEFFGTTSTKLSPRWANNVPHAYIRVLGDDWDLIEDDDGNICFKSLYFRVLFYYDTVYPYMKQFSLQLRNEALLKGAVEKINVMCNNQNYHKAYYMPPSRDMSYGKQQFLLRFVQLCEKSL